MHAGRVRLAETRLTACIAAACTPEALPCICCWYMCMYVCNCGLWEIETDRHPGAGHVALQHAAQRKVLRRTFASHVSRLSVHPPFNAIGAGCCYLTGTSKLTPIDIKTMLYN